MQEFDPICEVQSDKASVEITSRFEGVIKKLHYEADDVAIVGKPLLDIDITGEISREDEALLKTDEEGRQKEGKEDAAKAASGVVRDKDNGRKLEEEDKEPEGAEQQQQYEEPTKQREPGAEAGPVESRAKGKHATLATPAVRHLSRDLNIDLADVEGTGRDGRVLKEDLHKHNNDRRQRRATVTESPSAEPKPAQQQHPRAPASGESKVVALTPVQAAMFKSMTKSLAIPHFLYTHSVDFSALDALRASLNSSRQPADDTTTTTTTSSVAPERKDIKLSPLPFIIKAVSIALKEYPLLNAKLDASSSQKAQLHYRADHDVGLAIDSPAGLVVPVLRSVQEQSIRSVAQSIASLSAAARASKLTSADLSGGTITVSNIGSVGGAAAAGVVAPLLVEGQLCILGVGRARPVPAFDERGALIKRVECVFSWAADHRVVDGATMARFAERVASLLEEPGRIVVCLR